MKHYYIYRTHFLLWQFFEMQRDDAVRALEIYKKSGSQVYVVFYTLIFWS